MLLDVALPLSLAIIMLSLGIGLTFADFARVLKMPRAVGFGILAQIVALPLLALVLLQIFTLPPALAFGVMLLAFCPGGVTSNFLTKLSQGNVALSITLTAVVSLFSVVTVPIFVALTAAGFLGGSAPEINVTSIAISMFAITALPVAIGVLIRHFASGFAQKIEPVLTMVSTVLFLVIVVAAIALNWMLFVESLATLGPLLILLNILAIAVGFSLASALGLNPPDKRAISAELGVQNSTLGIAVASLISSGIALSEFAIPAAVYGVTMYFVTLPFLFILRRIGT